MPRTILKYIFFNALDYSNARHTLLNLTKCLPSCHFHPGVEKDNKQENKHANKK